MRYTLLSLGLLLAGQAATGQTAPTLDPTQFQSAAATDSPVETIGLKASAAVDSFAWRSPAPGLVGAAGVANAPAQLLRSVLDFRKEWRLGEQTRLTVSDRLEGLQDDHGHGTVRNALREAYASVGLSEDWFVDVGRINVRSGVGLGFNPSDWLREGASLPQATQNPASQRENRLGTAMLKVQAVQTWGAGHLALIPRLADRPSEVSPYGVDLGRTNADPALHARFAPQFSEYISVDALAYARQGRYPQWGLNATAVLGQAWIAHLEWSAGSREGLAGSGQARVQALHHRVASGVSWTAASGAVLAIERHLSTDALGREDWDAWRLSTGAASARGLGLLRAERSALQEPLLRDAWFARMALNGLLRDPDIDLSGFVRLNPHDHSSLWQLDGSWHASAHMSVHASVGGFAGSARSEFGDNPLRSFVTLRVEWAY
ncbi:MAG: hypothetical protein V4858_03070 [Pseudomonadota bacterium]